ncbi:hypothetical protein [Flagellimonas flava]|uniref:hypothetical protein n=1 Tax=Flagellimonas flava TaxID=570519 RepID=UPI003D6553A9
MEILIFNIGIVLFIFTVKFLITSKRKYKPDWEKNMTKYEKPVLVCSLIFYVLGLVLGNQIVSVVSLLPLVWLIVIEVRVISQKLKGNSIL